MRKVASEHSFGVLIYEFIYISYLFHFIYFLVKHISNIRFHMLDVIIGRHTWNCQIRTHIHTEIHTQTHTHTKEGKEGKKKERKKEKEKGVREERKEKKRQKEKERGEKDEKERKGKKTIQRGMGMGLGG